MSRRLQQLEARVSDGSGLPPNSSGWCDYWLQKYDEFVAGDRTIMFPLEAIRIIMRSIDSSAEVRPQNRSTGVQTGVGLED